MSFCETAKLIDGSCKPNGSDVVAGQLCRCHANYLPGSVDDGTTAVTGIEGGVYLDASALYWVLHQPGNTAGCDFDFSSENIRKRIANGEHRFGELQAVGIDEWERSEISVVDSDQCQVSRFTDSHDGCTIGTVREVNREICGTRDDMCTRGDQAIRCNDKSGSGRDCIRRFCVDGIFDAI